MNNQLFENVLAFDLDRQKSEYTFTTRLAKENNWTRNFTNEAIIEYKKFMYLAATANAMVSPSEIVDIVWHQHLIYTKSYKKFCLLLGKKIEHIPSTHDRAEAAKFKEAKERTTQLYEQNFGTQPANIWNFMKMYDSLQLEKARLDNNSVIGLGIMLFGVLCIAGHYLLEPFYMKIQGLNFIGGYLLLAIGTLSSLYVFNKNYLKKIFNKIDKDAFIFNLHPLELIYLKKNDIRHVINGVTNQAIINGKIGLDKDQLSLVKIRKPDDLDEYQILETLKSLGTTYYPPLLTHLVRNPLFLNIENSMKELKSYFSKVKVFSNLFTFNFVITGALLMLGIARLSIGVSREKPVMILVVLLVMLIITVAIFLGNLSMFLPSKALINYYSDKVSAGKMSSKNHWQWDYLLGGTAVFAASFVPIANYVTQNAGSSGHGASCGSCGSSCGSSCGGGCGGGCGGCGG